MIGEADLSRGVRRLLECMSVAPGERRMRELGVSVANTTQGGWPMMLLLY